MKLAKGVMTHSWMLEAVNVVPATDTNTNNPAGSSTLHIVQERLTQPSDLMAKLEHFFKVKLTVVEATAMYNQLDWRRLHDVMVAELLAFAGQLVATGRRRRAHEDSLVARQNGHQVLTKLRTRSRTHSLTHARTHALTLSLMHP